MCDRDILLTLFHVVKRQGFQDTELNNVIHHVGLYAQHSVQLALVGWKGHGYLFDVLYHSHERGQLAFVLAVDCTLQFGKQQVVSLTGRRRVLAIIIHDDGGDQKQGNSGLTGSTTLVP